MRAEGVDAGAIVRRPAVQIEGRVGRRIPDEIADGQLDGAAFVRIRLHVDHVAAAGSRDRVERDHGIGGAATGEHESTTLERDRVGGLKARRRRVGHRVHPVVIPIDGAVINLEAGRAANRPDIPELQRAAADDGFARVGVRIGEQRGAVTGTRERQITRDDAAETPSAGGGQYRG